MTGPEPPCQRPIPQQGAVKSVTDTTSIQTQKATMPLEHGRVVFEIDNAKVIRFIPDRLPDIEFVGEGIATQEINVIYQPTQESFPCLVSSSRFGLRVFWDDDSKEYLATPVHAGEMNRSSQWLYDGIQTMNALHRYWESRRIGSDDASSPSDHDKGHTSGSPIDRMAEIVGTILGAAGRTFFS